MNWKTTIVALMVFLTAVTFGSGEGRTDGHCTTKADELIEVLTGMYGEKLFATGDSIGGMLSFYIEPFDVDAGGAASPDTRTITILQNVTDLNIVCVLMNGVNVHVLPEPREVVANTGFASVITLLRDERTAYVTMVNPENADWHIVNITFMGTPFQASRIVGAGTNFNLLLETDPALKKITPWDG